MIVGRREFSGELDIQAMIALVHIAPSENLHVIDLPYRLSSWALDHPGNVGLWVSAEGQLLAWAVLKMPFWMIDYVCHPDAENDLHRQVLAWADARALAVLDTPAGHPTWFANVFAHQAGRIRDLEEAGFAPQADVGEESWSKVSLCRPAGMPVPEYSLAAGFDIRPMAGEEEVEDYVQLHRSVFESRNMTVAWRERTLHRPEYHGDLDLVAVAPDGRLAAFCVCWLDERLAEGPGGHIEPLGVHEDFRCLGLGQAILSEGLRRLSLGGARRVWVETDQYPNAALGLYAALEFRPVRDVLVYRKDYRKPQG